MKRPRLSEFPPLERWAVEMAARGCISRSLSKWPYLRQAFSRAGYAMPLTAGVREMQRGARAIMAQEHGDTRFESKPVDRE